MGGYMYCIYFLLIVGVKVSAEIGRPRGVSISMASKYEPNDQKIFRCLDGSGTIPYEHLNDDYCDCADGSDEPGTSACTNGKFHCTNAGYTPKNIQSSRVNDGVCDCCDGSDEYEGKIECVNNCKELGKKMREEQDEKRRLQEEGFKKREGFIAEANNMMEGKKLKIQELEKEKTELQDKLKELEAKKAEAEGPEKEAKDKHEQAWKEQKEVRDKERSAIKAREAFDELDLNKDGFVDVLEIIPHMEFDIDSNGVVSEEEAKEHLEDNEKVDFDEFSSRIWGNIQSIYKKLVPDDQKEVPPPPVEPQGETGVPVPNEEPQATPHITPIPDEGDDYDDEDDEDEDDEEDAVDEDKMPEYDEETKALIAAADEARKNHEEADKRSRDIDGEITTLTSYLNTDYGKDKEYAILRDNCYEYTDREYTYKLCPFATASQRPKAGGHETNLGRWGRWENDYKVQVYDHGQNCWNGPDRSVKVHLTCGPEHQLTNAYEPSRCEYAFDFITPCACNQPPQPQDKDPHDEL
ncbi:glucosidase 2 subunit beta-like isoform X2 [Crassostrea angulata]|uniref:glucosidase 2 subunit beta-like isoform X2 n=1 Tax=Magallana angulata TaxID=2784310 RepID=UPI0005C362F3|nr:glucosidase 2 subunit beta-like isoform X2 [Crassostrea angulata]|eukprot:XP_011432051.1 PREDICTED: glucosidase 2 subunit beta isoform X2 [Crassostrea gigas]